MVFAKIDVEDAVELADSFSITTLLTVVLLKGGTEVHRVVGEEHVLQTQLLLHVLQM